eukprot:m.27401 g.27401  ORF g.27401 m.27401 type:complete len:252 (-) comp5937_c0_seq1:1527-2282(-)
MTSVPLGKLSLEVGAGKIPTLIVSCGSFSPPTFLHLRIFEEAKDFLCNELGIIGGIISPVHQAYGKSSLAPMKDRLEMCKLATQDSSWISVSSWEASQEGWSRTYDVLQQMKKDLANIAVTIGNDPPIKGAIKTMLICGSDLLATFDTKLPDGSDLWAMEHRKLILTEGVIVLEREGDCTADIIKHSEVLSAYKQNIRCIHPKVVNTVSSTIVRELVTENKSIKYLVPALVEKYIFDNELNHLPNWKCPTT